MYHKKIRQFLAAILLASVVLGQSQAAMAAESDLPGEELLIEEDLALEELSEELSEDVSSNDSEVVIEEDSDLELTEELLVTAAASSGQCGTNAKWNYTSSTKTLTISGTGAITDYDLTNLAPWYAYKNDILHIVVKEGITEIGTYAFHDLGKVCDVSLPNSVESINDYAFHKASNGYNSSKDEAFKNAKTMKFPSKLKRIGKKAFYMASYIKIDTSTLPTCLEVIDDEAFNFTYGVHGDLYLTNNLKYLGSRAFYSTTLDGKVTIPSSITVIPMETFWRSSITGLSLPSTLKTIKNGAFAECNNLDFKDFTFPDALEELDIRAFENDRFTKITFGKKVKKVQGFKYHPASSSDQSIAELTVVFTGDMPEMPANGSKSQFEGYDVTAFYPKNNSTWTQEKLEKVSQYFDCVTWVKEGDTPPVKKDDLKWSYNEETQTLTISGTGRMRDYPANGAKPWSECLPKVKKVVIENKVESIGNYAFNGAEKLEEISIGTGVKEVGKNAFLKTAIRELKFPKALEKLSVKSLDYMTRLEKMSFEGNPPEILDETNTYYGTVCITYPAQNSNWTEDYLLDLRWAIGSLESGTALFFPYPDKDGNSCGSKCTWKVEGNVLTISGLGSIKDYSLTHAAPWMMERKSIQKVVISENITEIGAYAFHGFKNLNVSMYVPSSVKKIGDHAFYMYGSYGGGLTFDDKCRLEYVGDSAFNHFGGKVSGIEAAIRNADTIEYDAFESTDIAEFEDLEINARVIGVSSFHSCRNIKTLKIGDNTKKIGGMAFNDATALVSVELGKNVEELGNRAFEGVTVEEFVIPDSVKVIGINATPSVTKKLTVGKNVKSAEGLNLEKHKADVWFTGDYADLTAIKNQYHTIHFTRYNASWMRGIRALGTTNLTFVPEGKEREVICTVKFVTGTEQTVPAVKVRFGERISAPSVKNGSLTLDGWYTEKEYVNKFDFYDEVYEDMTLFARWIDEKDTSWGDITEEDRKEMGFSSPRDVEDKLWIAEVPASVNYSGKAITFKNFRVYRYKKLLKKDKDYTVKYSNNTKAGTATLTVTGKGKYKGTVKKSFTINQISISKLLNNERKLADGTKYKLTATRESYVKYDGKVHKIKPTIKLLRNGKAVTFKQNVNFKYVYNTSDYDYKSEGKHPIQIVGIGNYTGSVTVYADITKKTRISKATIKKIPEQNVTGNYVTLSNKDLKVTYKGKTLKEFQDYTVSYTDNYYAGTAKVIIKGIGNYCGTKTSTFRLKGRPFNKCYVDIQDDNNTYFEGGAYPGHLYVYADATKKDFIYTYDREYKNNKKVGTATVILTGKGFYEGTIKRNYKIVGESVNDIVIKGVKKSCEYTGEAITFDNAEYKHDQTGVKPNVNYSGYRFTATYSNNVKVGTAKLKLHGAKYFYGDRTLEYQITPFKVTAQRAEKNETGSVKDGGRIIVKMADSYTYVKGGTKAAPEIYFVTAAGRKVPLKNKTDYTLSYKNINKKGTGEVTITFKGNFKGSLTYKYEIKAK